MLNVVVLIGRLTRKPELRYTPQGLPVARFAVAVDRPRRSGGQDPGVDFVEVSVWRGQAEPCARYLDKGSPVAVEGRLQVRDWEGRDGQKRRCVEVVALRVEFLPNARRRVPEEPAPSGEELPPEQLPFGEEEA